MEARSVFAQPDPRARLRLFALLVFTVLLGLLNFLTVNQRVVLYLFYLPVASAGWLLSRRDTLGVSLLAALTVVAYHMALPDRIGAPTSNMLVWADLMVWGGILVVTAYMISTLRGRSLAMYRDLQTAYRGVLTILTRFIQTVDMDTEAHSVRVSAWAVRLADALGVRAPQVEEIRIAALLHDVGKVEVGGQIIRKAAKLSDQERQRVVEHTTHGAMLVRPVGGLLMRVAEAVETHHEKFDGTGPEGLRGEQIPHAARIIAVADAFDALLSDRPYRKGVGIFEAVDRIAAAASSHFDPDVVSALARIVAREHEDAVAATMTHAANRRPST